MSKPKGLTLTLPFPPTVNSYWRSPPGRGVILSEKGRAYRQAIAEAVMIQRQRKGFTQILTDRLAVYIEAYPPRAGRRDLDNLLKALLDGMQHAGIYEDDSQIDHLEISRREVTPPGLMVVTINKIYEYNIHD